MPFADTWPDVNRGGGGGLAVRAKGETGRRSYPCEPLTGSADEADQGAQGRPQERDEREPGEPVSAGAPRRGGEGDQGPGRRERRPPTPAVGHVVRLRVVRRRRLEPRVGSALDTGALLGPFDPAGDGLLPGCREGGLHLAEVEEALRLGRAGAALLPEHPGGAVDLHPDLCVVLLLT